MTDTKRLVIDQVQGAIADWEKYARESHVGKTSLQLISKTLRQLTD